MRSHYLLLEVRHLLLEALYLLLKLRFPAGQLRCRNKRQLEAILELGLKFSRPRHGRVTLLLQLFLPRGRGHLFFARGRRLFFGLGHLFLVVVAQPETRGVFREPNALFRDTLVLYALLLEQPGLLDLGNLRLRCHLS